MSRAFVPAGGLFPLPWRSPRFSAAFLVAAGVLALAAGKLSLTGLTSPAGVPPAVQAAAARAEAALRRAEERLWRAREEAGAADPEADPRRTGMIGEEWTPLTTTLGSLAAKRTAAEPRWAGELARRMWLAGVRENDLVAAGFSGSFPGLNLAVALACESLGARLGAVSSVTASTFGANQPGFTWPEMEVFLVREGFLKRPVSLGVSLGGDGDQALELEPAGRRLAGETARRSAEALGAVYLAPSGFSDSVQRRLDLYRRWARGRRLALYVNVGGTEASLGRSSSALRLRSGFLSPVAFDFSPERGVMARLAESGVPLLHLLNVRDLAVRWGIPLSD